MQAEVALTYIYYSFLNDLQHHVIQASHLTPTNFLHRAALRFHDGTTNYILDKESLLL